MIGIEAVAVELPSRRVATEAIASAIGLEHGALQASVGFKSLARAPEEQDVSDLCEAAATALFSTEGISADSIECAAVVSQSPVGYGIPHTAAILQPKLGLPVSCACFDIGLGGSGYVHGLAVLKSFMESNGFSRGLLFTCDLYSRFVGEMDGHASLLFGDAATVTLLSDQPKWTIGRSLFGTLGSRGQAIQVRVRLGGRLVVESEGVAEFAKKHGVEALRKVLQTNALSMGQVDRVVVHQAWKSLVEGIGDALQVPEKTGFYAEEYGDTTSSSIPIVLSHHLEPSDRCVALYGFGSGLSYATTVLQRVGQAPSAL